MRLVWVALVAVLVATAGAEAKPSASAKVPREVTSWYADVLTLYRNLDKALSVAPDQAAQVKAFENAAAFADKKRLQGRYDDLVNHYPDFFGPSRQSSWSAPPEWADATDAFTRELSTYTFRIPILSSDDNPELNRAAAKLAKLLSGFSGD